ncbi:hypothetical protein [Maritimibacter sp. DP1N21-5]|uniref:hypothetical protein n=1 Tax=Maritimibacter sp. DP1N21-5 TaxID=2836867 RepID=UPI001C45B70F|nr:hypothetical protein [Maritimibacter sp. DP1N21-5]MBV7408016.1 hypothetical protein [Maritimibacter sp. DP1N21-5]
MKHVWLIDVMADLRAFADAKGLRASAAALDDAILVATAELAARGGLGMRSDERGDDHEGQSSNVAFLFGERRHA